MFWKSEDRVLMMNIWGCAEMMKWRRTKWRLKQDFLQDCWRWRLVWFFFLCWNSYIFLFCQSPSLVRAYVVLLCCWFLLLLLFAVAVLFLCIICSARIRDARLWRLKVGELQRWRFREKKVEVSECEFREFGGLRWGWWLWWWNDAWMNVDEGSETGKMVRIVEWRWRNEGLYREREWRNSFWEFLVSSWSLLFCVFLCLWNKE